MPEERSERAWVVGFDAETGPYKTAVEAIEKLNEQTAASFQRLASEIEDSGVATKVAQISTAADRALAKVRAAGGARAPGGIGAGRVGQLRQQIRETRALAGKLTGGPEDKALYAQARKNIRGYIQEIRRLQSEQRQTAASATATAKNIRQVGAESVGAGTDVSKMEKYLGRMAKTSKKTARATGQNAAAMHRLREEFQKVSGPLARHAQQLQNQAHVSKTVLSAEEKVIAKFKQAFGRLGVWTIATGTIYMFVQAMRQVVGTLIEVQYGMAQLEKVMVPGASFEKIEAGFWAIAKRYGLAITDVVRSGKIFAQQGRSQVEVLNLTKAALLGVTAAGLEEKQAIEAVTAAQKIFNIDSADAVTIIDKMARVQARHAVTAQDLADAIKTVGPVVRMLNGDINDVIGVTTALVAVTRQSGKYVANAMKTVFARFARPTTRQKFMKLMGGFDIKETEKEFKPLREILRGLRNEWFKLGSVERAVVAQAAGGIRRYKDFVVLMDNYAEVITATRDSQEAFRDAQRMSAIEAETLKRRLMSLTATWLELGSTILKGAYFPQALGLMTAGLIKYGDALEAVAKISPPLGTAFAIGSAVVGLILAEVAFRRLAHSMIPAITKGSAVVSVLKWMGRGLQLGVIALGSFIMRLNKSSKAYGRFGRAVRGLTLAKLIVNPWVLGAAAVAAMTYAVYRYYQRMKDLESGKVLLDAFTEKWDAHAISVSGAMRALESYVKTINEMTDVGEKVKPFYFMGITEKEALAAQQMALGMARGGRATITPTGLIPGTVIEAARRAEDVETVADVQALFAGTREAMLQQTELLSHWTRTEEALKNVSGGFKAVIAETLNLGSVSDKVLRTLVVALEAPETKFKALAAVLKAEDVPADQVDRLRLALEKMEQSLEKPWYEKWLTVVSEIPGAKGQMPLLVGAIEQKRLGEYTAATGLLISQLGRWKAAEEALKKVRGIKEVLEAGIEDAEAYAEAVVKVKDAYFEITDPIQRTLENMEAQAEVFQKLGLGYNLYERQLGVVKKAAAALTTQELLLTNAYRNAQHALDLARERATADRGLAGEKAKQAIELMEKQARQRKAALDLFQEQNTAEQDYLQILIAQLEPLSNITAENAKTVRWVKEELSLYEKSQAALLKLNQLGKYGADESRFIEERARERIALEEEMYSLRSAALDDERALGSMADSVYKNRKATLETQHKGNLLGIRQKALFQSQQGLLSGITAENAKVVRQEQEKLSLSEKYQTAVLKLNQLEKYGADESRFIVQRVQERLALEEQLYPLRLVALENERTLKKLGDVVYKDRKAALELQHESNLLGIRQNAVLQARQALLDRERSKTETIRSSVREALADWEGLSSGKGIVNLFDTIARRQRELLADAVVQMLPSKIGNIFLDPRRQLMQEELIIAESVAATIQRGWVNGAQMAVQITAAKLPGAVEGAAPIIRGGALLPPAGGIVAAAAAAKAAARAEAKAPRPPPAKTPDVWSRKEMAGVQLAGMGATMLSARMGGNAANAQLGSTIGMMIGAIVPGGGALTAGIGSALGGLVGGLFGREKKEEEVKVTQENTKALRENTQATAEMSQMIISAPGTFMMPAVKGQIPNYGNGGDVLKSGLAFVHKGETISTGPTEININVAQREGENTQNFAERVWKLADEKYGNETRRSGSRGRMTAN